MWVENYTYRPWYVSIVQECYHRCLIVVNVLKLANTMEYQCNLVNRTRLRSIEEARRFFRTCGFCVARLTRADCSVSVVGFFPCSLFGYLSPEQLSTFSSHISISTSTIFDRLVTDDMDLQMVDDFWLVEATVTVVPLVFRSRTLADDVNLLFCFVREIVNFVGRTSARDFDGWLDSSNNIQIKRIIWMLSIQRSMRGLRFKVIADQRETKTYLRLFKLYF